MKQGYFIHMSKEIILEKGGKIRGREQCEGWQADKNDKSKSFSC